MQVLCFAGLQKVSSLLRLHLNEDPTQGRAKQKLDFYIMKDGYSLSRAPKARAKKIFGIVGMKMCKIIYLFTIQLSAEKPTNALQSTSYCVRLLCTNPPSGLIKIKISALHSFEKSRLAQQLLCNTRIMLQMS